MEQAPVQFSKDAQNRERRTDPPQLVFPFSCVDSIEPTSLHLLVCFTCHLLHSTFSPVNYVDSVIAPDDYG